MLQLFLNFTKTVFSSKNTRLELVMRLSLPQFFLVDLQETVLVNIWWE